MRLRRRSKLPPLAEIPAAGDSSRPGALGRGGLDACSDLAGRLAGSAAVLLTGPERSGVALGLAAAATAAGRRVALLECDLAAPRLARTLGLAEAPGFGEYLRGEAEPAGILQPLMLAGPASGRAVEPLACLVAGEVEPASMSLLTSERCRHAVEKLRHAYELLVIAGPSLAQDLDSLRALAKLADPTIACVERAHIPKRPPAPVSALVVVG